MFNSDSKIGRKNSNRTELYYKSLQAQVNILNSNENFNQNLQMNMQRPGVETGYQKTG